MPPARTVRRAVTDENAENVGTSRLTRAKAASLTTDDVVKKTLTTKRTTTGVNGALGARKRTALGDVSNVAKKDPSEGVEGKKQGILSKTTKPAGIQKAPARANSTRTVLGQKTTTNTSSDLKRPASVVSTNVPLSKRRNISTVKSVNADEDENEAFSENVPPAKNGATVDNKARKAEYASEDDEEYGASLEELIKDAKDLDAEDLNDPTMVAEYVHEIFEYMKELEIATMPNPDYIDNQDELEWNMRGILVDWLLEVHTRFRLLPETLFLTVNIIDRFLSCKVVQLNRLQLVGVTAMFIASKYEEVLSPHVQNFIHVSEDGFTEQDMLTAERYILSTLDYDLSYPNPMNFLRRISKADAYDIQTRTLGKFLLEIGCLDHRFLPYPPSHVAAAAMYLARKALDRGDWDSTLTKYAGYTKEDIMPVFELMVDYLYAPVEHDAFIRKYANKKFLKASIILRQWAQRMGPRLYPYLVEKYAEQLLEEQRNKGKTGRSHASLRQS